MKLLNCRGPWYHEGSISRAPFLSQTSHVDRVFSLLRFSLYSTDRNNSHGKQAWRTAVPAVGELLCEPDFRSGGAAPVSKSDRAGRRAGAATKVAWDTASRVAAGVSRRSGYHLFCAGDFSR